MATTRDSVKKQIILATINIIEKEGINSITTRKIAKEAGVNIAAINYYFGTKDDFLKEIFEHLINHFSKDIEVILTHTELSLFSLLKVFLTFILRGSMEFPNIMKALLFQYSYYPEYGNKFSHQFERFNERVEKLLTEALNLKDHQKSKTSLMLMQMFNAVLSPGIWLPMQNELFGIDLGRKENQLYYIDELLLHYLPWIKSGDIKREGPVINSLIEQLFRSPDSFWE